MQLPPPQKASLPRRPSREEVLHAVQMQGPILPSQIMRALGGDTMIIGAMLSELAANRLVKISNTKIGGSPTYYAPGQEAKLEGLTRHLNGKDRETVALLKEQNVLRDDTQTPLVRVSLRNVKDFAKKVEVNLPNGPVIFWRYYLMPEQDAAVTIKHALGLDKPKEEAKQAEALKQAHEEPRRTAETTLPLPEAKTKPAKAPSRPRKPMETTTAVQSSLPGMLEHEDTAFYAAVQKYFDKNSITVQTAKILTKKTQYEYTIHIPSPVGTLAYYCMARDKKVINDGDLSSAYLQGQKRGMPILYLTTGKLTKKTQTLLSADFKSMTVKEI